MCATARMDRPSGAHVARSIQYGNSCSNMRGVPPFAGTTKTVLV